MHIFTVLLSYCSVSSKKWLCKITETIETTDSISDVLLIPNEGKNNPSLGIKNWGVRRGKADSYGNNYVSKCT